MEVRFSIFKAALHREPVGYGSGLRGRSSERIGDGALIGHNVVLATINYDLNPKGNRKNHYAPIRIGAHV